MASEVSDWVWDHSRARNGGRLVLLAIARAADAEGEITMSVMELARLAGVSVLKRNWPSSGSLKSSMAGDASAVTGTSWSPETPQILHLYRRVTPQILHPLAKPRRICTPQILHPFQADRRHHRRSARHPAETPKDLRGWESPTCL